MIDPNADRDAQPVKWGELRLALADIVEFSNQLTVYAAAIQNASEDERKTAEKKLRDKAVILEQRYGLDEFLAK